jgi:ribosomal protein S12 methylthiotransferase accessory factor
MRVDSSSLLKVDLVEEPKLVTSFNDEPKFPTYSCLPTKSFLQEYKIDPKLSYGVGSADKAHADIAKSKAIGECIERSCLQIIPKSIHDTKFPGSEQKYVDPTLFVHYEFSRVGRYSSNAIKYAKYAWYRSYDYFNKKFVYIPAQTIFLTNKFFIKEPALLKETITTGAAFGKIGEEELFKTALLEVVERDAFILSYSTKKAVNKVIELPQEVQDLVSYLDRYNLKTYILDITTDLDIPVFAVVVIDKTGLGPAVSIGAKAGFDYENTIKEALLEAVRPRSTLRFRHFTKTSKKRVKETGIRSLEDRLEYWYDVDKLKYLNFWLDGKRTIKYCEIRHKNDSLHKGIKELKDRRYHIFVTSVGIPAIKRLGFDVIKVNVPELHPLYLNENAKVLYSKHAGLIKEIAGLKPQPFG